MKPSQYNYRTPSGRPAPHIGMTDEELNEWEDWTSAMNSAEAHDVAWILTGAFIVLASIALIVLMFGIPEIN